MNDDAASLLRQWWSTLPTMFPWMQVPNATAAPSTSTANEGADVFSFDRLLSLLFDAWQPLLRPGAAPTDGLWSMASQIEANFGKLRESLASTNVTPMSLGWPMPTAPMPWTTWGAPLLFAAGSASPSGRANPLQIGADRTFGAFADAFGLRPMREMQEAWVELGEAETERRAAQAAYVALAAKAWADGTRGLIARLEQMRQNGEQVTTFLGFVRLWAREADAAVHKAMQSEEGLAAAAFAVRATGRQRAALQRLVALASHTLNVPTRAEVDDAYREIQELKRELRRLKKGVPHDEVETKARSRKTREPKDHK